MDPWTGKLLVAMPTMPDPRFAHSVVLLCAHSPEGAMGLIVNKPLPDLRLRTLLDTLDLPVTEQALGLGSAFEDRDVHFGGPVETGRGFVLHSPDFFSEEGSAQVLPGLALTTSVEILAEMGRGQGPAEAIVALGYAGWGPRQLEAEIQAGGWLLADGTPHLVLGLKDHAKWLAALKTLGVDPRHLSGASGHA
ncbi:MAG: YqgE/AlgH family protein [Roseinatronobacter sp.]